MDLSLVSRSVKSSTDIVSMSLESSWTENCRGISPCRERSPVLCQVLGGPHFTLLSCRLAPLWSLAVSSSILASMSSKMRRDILESHVGAVEGTGGASPCACRSVNFPARIASHSSMAEHVNYRSQVLCSLSDPNVDTGSLHVLVRTFFV